MVDPDRGLTQVWGRLRPGANPVQLKERLQPALTNFLRDRARINPPRNLRPAQVRQLTGTPLLVRDASTGAESLFRAQFRRPLSILALICALLLLVACSNVANLMLARASARDAEMALRISLGAGRMRLIRQLLVESGQIAVAATMLAYLLAAGIVPAAVARLGPTEFPAWLDVAPGARTIAFAAAIGVLTAVLFGVAPALRASSASPEAALRGSGRQLSRRTGSLQWMLAAEIGFSVAVLFLSGLLLLSFRKLTEVPLGFAPENVALFDIGPRVAAGRHPSSGAELLRHLRRLPEVESASLTLMRPMGGDMVWIITPIVRLPGRPNEAVRPREVAVSEGFFRAMRIPWISGRDFRPEEIASDSPSVVVNQAFVDQYFHGENPLGRQFEKLSDDPKPARQEIIGVVGNSRYNNLREPDQPTIYSPLRDAATATVNIRTVSTPKPLMTRLRREIEAADPSSIVRGSILLSTQIDNTMISERLLAILAGFFSTAALLLAGVGLYGVINYAAVQRTREIGIRVALGARRASIVKLMASDAGVFVLGGTAVGIAGGLGFGRYLASQLFGVRGTDVASLIIPVALILAVSSAAILSPALRAARLDPASTLRE